MARARISVLAFIGLIIVIALFWRTPTPDGTNQTLTEQQSAPEPAPAAIATLPADRDDHRAPALPDLDLPAIDHAPLIAKAERLEASKNRYRFATQRRVDAKPSTHGQWTSLGDGRSRWELDVHSAGADSLNFAFIPFALPPGAALTLTGEKNGTEHVFTSRDNEEHGELWTPLFRGDSVRVQLEVPDALAATTRLQLASVNHGFRTFRPKSKIGGDASGACNVDVVCDASDDAVFGALIDTYRDQIDSVGAYTLGGIDTCSGALINNALNDNTPYFLTAHHCGVTAGAAPSMVVYWNFQNTTCRTPGSGASGSDGDGPLVDFNTGAILRATYSTTDFTLVELDDPVAATSLPYYAGWSRTGANTSTAIAIHHPAISEKRISFELDSTTNTNAYSNSVNQNGTHVRVTDWDFGTTEGGSSGSPLFDIDGRIIGQLEGGDAACGNDDSDWYGRLALSWNGGGSSSSRLSNWLDPASSGASAIDGIGSDERLEITNSTVTEGDSGSQNTTVTVTLTPPANETVTVRLRTTTATGNAAVAGSDYIALNTILTFAPGQTQRTAQLTVLGDTTPEEHETIALELVDAVNAFAQTDTGSVVILNNDFGAAPNINSSLVITVPEGAPIDYQITALGTPTSYSISAAPAGMTVDTLTGVLEWAPPIAGTYTVAISATNPAGTDTDTLTIIAEPDSLARALDLAPGFSPTTVGTPWFRQTSETHDSEDAARSGAIGHSASSEFSIAVTGPDHVSFWWKASSEADYDILSFRVDSNLVAEISGATSWEQVAFTIPAGDHQLVWKFSRDASDSAGLNTSWVDEIEFASAIPHPVITSSREVIYFSGEPFSYQIVATKTPTLYGATSLPPGLSLNPTTGMISGAPIGAGPWSFNIWAENAAGRDTVGLAIGSGTLDSALATAADQPELALENNPSRPWVRDFSTHNLGGSSMRSGDIGDSETTALTAHIEGPGEISFDWRVSSEQGYDYLVVSLNGVERGAISGNLGWGNETISLPPGTHEVTWSYEKDENTSRRADAGWVDNITLSGYAAYVTDAGLRLGLATPSANLDGDSASNLLEYVLGIDASVTANPAPPSLVVRPAGGLTFAITGATAPTGAGMSLEENTILGSDSWTPTAITPTSTPIGGGRSTYQFTLPGSPGTDRKFYRIRASFIEP